MINPIFDYAIINPYLKLLFIFLLYLFNTWRFFSFFTQTHIFPFFCRWLISTAEEIFLSWNFQFFLLFMRQKYSTNYFSATHLSHSEAHISARFFTLFLSTLSSGKQHPKIRITSFDISQYQLESDVSNCFSHKICIKWAKISSLHVKFHRIKSIWQFFIHKLVSNCLNFAQFRLNFEFPSILHG